MGAQKGNTKEGLVLTLQELRIVCARRGTNVTAVARKIKRSRSAIYSAIRRPSTFPRTYKKLMEVINEG